MVRDVFWKRDMIIFFEDVRFIRKYTFPDGNVATDIGLRYREMLTPQFLPIIDDIYITDK